jgi:hydrogenase maturation protein HypF
MRLQTLAETHIAQHDTPKAFVFSTFEQGELRLIDPAPLWSQIATEQAAGVSSEQIAARFHVGWADVWAETVEHAEARHGVNRIFLSGGVFQNRLFASMLRQRLERYGLSVHEHREVPANDGGLALGQIAIALALHSADKRN